MKFNVWPLLVVNVTAAPAPVLSVLVALRDVGGAAGVAGEGDAAAGVVGVVDLTGEGDGAAGAAGDLGAGAGAVVEVAGVGDGAGAAVEVEGDPGGAGDVAGEGGERAGAEVVEVDPVGAAVGGVDVVEVEGARRPVTSMAGPPVAEMLSVPAASTVRVPVWVEKNAAVVPDVVVRARSVPEPSPRLRVPVVAVRLTAPVDEPVTVIASMTLAVPKLVVAPEASRPLAPAVVIGWSRRGEVDGAGVGQRHTDRRRWW